MNREKQVETPKKRTHRIKKTYDALNGFKLSQLCSCKQNQLAREQRARENS